MLTSLTDIEKTLKESFNPTQLVVTDQSASHRNHKGWREGYITHIDIFIISVAFRNQTKIKTHKMVYDVLGDFFKKGLHAVSMTTKADLEI